MSDTGKKIEMSKYLVDYMQDNCTEEEKQKVENWLKSEENRKLFNSIKSQDSEQVYKRYNTNISSEKKNFIRSIKRVKKILIYKRISVAASIAVLILIPFLLHQKKEIKPSKNNNVIALNIQKKKHKAPVLYTDSGQKIDLGDSSQSKTIKENNGVKVNLKGKKLTYDVNKIKTAIAYNTIKVPKSSEYFFKMNDGTKVWLNSDTKIKYPIPFHGDRREIYVEGEAYFEVAKNKHKPFIVNFPKGKIKVLGTKFNIKSYKDKAVEATLVSGSVYIEDNQKNSVVLKPSHQAIINNNKLKTRKVDPYMYICWKEGYFFYNNVELDIILNELSEWYDFEYIYKDKRISNIHLTAKIRRYDNFETIIDMLQRTGGIKFTKKNKMIIIDFE